MKLRFLPLLALISVSCTSEQQAGILFDKKVKYFKIVSGQKFTTNFAFSNPSNSDLTIKSVDASCGCLVIRFPTHPILPGGVDSIVVTYDSNVNKTEGPISNDILVESNTNPILHSLSVEGEVRGLTFNR